MGLVSTNVLLLQVPNPVKWADTIRYLAAQGVQRFIEVGAGNVLTGLLRSIDATREVNSII